MKKHVLPIIASKLDATKSQIQADIAQKLSISDHVIKENISNICKSRVSFPFPLYWFRLHFQPNVLPLIFVNVFRILWRFSAARWRLAWRRVCSTRTPNHWKRSFCPPMKKRTQNSSNNCTTHSTREQSLIRTKWPNTPKCTSPFTTNCWISSVPCPINCKLSMTPRSAHAHKKLAVTSTRIWKWCKWICWKHSKRTSKAKWVDDWQRPNRSCDRKLIVSFV